MKQTTKTKAKGRLKEARGRLKKAADRTLKNPELESRGRVNIWAGKSRRKFGQAEQVFEI